MSEFDLECTLANVQGLVDELCSIRWKKQQVGFSNIFYEFSDIVEV